MSKNYRLLKDKWKVLGEIPDWYSTNSLQFFMDKYSYDGESVRSRDTTIAESLAAFAPDVYPDWWETDKYTKGKSYKEVFFNIIWEGLTALSTPLKANAGIPDRGLTVSCCGQHMENSVASKAFIRGELEVLIKNSHGCSMSVSEWLSEGTVYDKDGNMSAGVIPVIDDMQDSTMDINQG
jgi:ribonucleoside-diphosphate reductase alpha chain